MFTSFALDNQENGWDCDAELVGKGRVFDALLGKSLNLANLLCRYLPVRHATFIAALL